MKHFPHSNYKKTLVIGSEGFIGRHFLKAYRHSHPDSIGTHRIATNTALAFDLCQPDLAELPIRKGEYGYALIAAAVPRIGECERDKEKTFLTNVTGTLKLAEQLVERNITPILFSSDYVFDGKTGGYNETSPTNPLNEYGRQKVLLEQRIKEICNENYLMIRPSKVYGMIRGDKTLLDEMAGLFLAGKTVRAAFDQTFCPILIEDLINAIIYLQANDCRGLFHICGPEIWNRFEIASALAKELQVKESLVQKISLDDLKESFLRPKKTDMKSDKFQKTSGMKMTPLSESIRKMGELAK